MVVRLGRARFPETNYKTTRYCVAYLDMLGGKKIICNDDKSEHLNKINMIYGDAIYEAKFVAKDEEPPIFVKIFSDNLLLAIRTDDDKNRTKNVEKILIAVSNIIRETADYGYLMRGAITEGEFFGNDIIAYGQALVEEVEMEGKYAIYPRIIVKKEVASLFPQYFYMCADGWNMLNHYLLGGGADMRSKMMLLKQLKENKADKKALQKIIWAITNFNLISDSIRKMGWIDAYIITPEEIEEAIK